MTHKINIYDLILVESKPNNGYEYISCFVLVSRIDANSIDGIKINELPDDKYSKYEESSFDRHYFNFTKVNENNLIRLVYDRK